MAHRLHRTLVLATALAIAPALMARAQDVDLRTLDPSSDPTAATGADSGAADPTPTPASAASSSSADVAAPATGADATPDDPDSPNYGKPRKKKPKLYVPDPKGSPPLSRLVPYRGAPGLQHRALNPAAPQPTSDSADLPLPAPTVAVIPGLPLPKPTVVEADPFAPAGVQIGALRLLPFVETSAGYETNPNQVTSGLKPSAALTVNGGFDLTSDFSAHSLTASLRGGYSEYPSNSDANRPNLSGTIVSRIDVTHNDQIDLEGRFTLATQTPGSSLLAVPNSATITSRPSIVSEGATIGGTHAFNRLSLGLHGTIDRTEYGDATNYKYSQDNYNDYGVVARASYELTPAIIPFSEIGFDSRVRDTPIDVAGYHRDSIGGTAKVGSTLEFGRLLTGTLSGGYLDRHYADARLPNLRGPTVDGALTYAATPLTKITLRATTTAAETTLMGASGAISRQFSVEVGHTFFRDFALTGIATYQPNEYQGVAVNEHFIQLSLKGAYSISRDVQLTASATHQNLSSSLAGNSYSDTIFLLGVRLQR